MGSQQTICMLRCGPDKVLIEHDYTDAISLPKYTLMYTDLLNFELKTCMGSMHAWYYSYRVAKTLCYYLQQIGYVHTAAK